MHSVCFCQKCNWVSVSPWHSEPRTEAMTIQIMHIQTDTEITNVYSAQISVLDGIPHSVLKDWRKVRKLKQTGEAFLQDDSCVEFGPNVQKCRECRLDRSRKSQEPAISPVFCRFYYFRRSVFNTFGTVLGHMWTPCDALYLGFICVSSLVRYLLKTYEVMRSTTSMICTQVCLKLDNHIHQTRN